MIKLEGEYIVKGQSEYKYRVIKREGDVIMSTVHYKNPSEYQIGNKSVDRIIGYEVFIVRKYGDRYSPNGQTFIPAKESPPSTTNWGSDSGSFVTLLTAEKKFAELVQKELDKALGIKKIKKPKKLKTTKDD